MRRRKSKTNCWKIVLPLPDLDHAKASVLNSLISPQSRRNYRFAMDQFIAWYCSEPLLALIRTVVLRFRLYLESLGLAAATINQRLAAVRRLAYEAADSGLLSPELAASIRCVKEVKHLGQRSGNWLTIDQAQSLVHKSVSDGLRNKRDFAMISILLGCGLRRAELAAINIEDIQIRQGHLVVSSFLCKRFGCTFVSESLRCCGNRSSRNNEKQVGTTEYSLSPLYNVADLPKTACCSLYIVHKPVRFCGLPWTERCSRAMSERKVFAGHTRTLRSFIFFEPSRARGLSRRASRSARGNGSQSAATAG